MPRAETFPRSRLGEISCQVEGNLSSTPPAFQSQDCSCWAEALAVAISKAQPSKATLGRRMVFMVGGEANQPSWPSTQNRLPDSVLCEGCVSTVVLYSSVVWRKKW